MALVFSDSQIKTMSQDIIELPKIIDFPLDPVTNDGGTGLVQQKQAVAENRDALYITDQQNKVFTDHWKAVSDSYHLELETLSLQKNTNYDLSNIDLGGQSLEPHYTPSHPELIPIVLPENNGQPVEASTIEENEVPKLNRMNDLISKYLNGIGGSSDDFLDSSWTDGQPVNTQNGTSFSEGSLVILTQGSNVMLARVGASSGSCDGETPPNSGTDESTCVTNGGTWTKSVVLNAVSAPMAFGVGSKVQNYSPAFTNAQRGRQSGLSSQDTKIMEIFEQQIDLAKIEVVTFIQLNLTILNSNPETNPTRKADNETYKNILNSKVTEFNTWSGLVVSDINGKYTDGNLPAIRTSLNAIGTLVPNRSSQITTMLGSVISGGGNVTGDGVYFDLWKFLTIRIAKSGGTLYSWYGMGLAVKHFDIKIDNANSQLEEYENIFIVKKLTEDIDLGENEVTVENTNDLSETDTVKVFDNETPVFSTAIQEINGNIVTLSQSVPSEYLTGNLARLVKEK